MVEAGGPGSVRNCPKVALAGDVDVSGEEDHLYAYQLSDGASKKKMSPNVDIYHAVPRRLHTCTLVFTGSKWVAFADLVQHTGWLIDLKISSPYAVTGKEHKLRKIVKRGTRLCSFILETKNRRF